MQSCHSGWRQSLPWTSSPSPITLGQQTGHNRLCFFPQLQKSAADMSVAAVEGAELILPNRSTSCLLRVCWPQPPTKTTEAQGTILKCCQHSCNLGVGGDSLICDNEEGLEQIHQVEWGEKRMNNSLLCSFFCHSWWRVDATSFSPMCWSQVWVHTISY